MAKYYIASTLKKMAEKAKKSRKAEERDTGVNSDYARTNPCNTKIEKPATESKCHLCKEPGETVYHLVNS